MTKKNPFSVSTPEDLRAVDATKLFVDVFTDFYKIRDPGHSMLNGPRGSGKSMMFRYLEPDCQRIVSSCDISQLEFFAVLISIKNMELNLTELRALVSTSSNAILNEHFLTMYVASKVFTYISELGVDDANQHVADVNAFVTDTIMARLVRCGANPQSFPASQHSTTKEAFSVLANLFDQLYQDLGLYVKRLFPGEAPATFTGPLCGYLSFLHPVLKQLRALPFMPQKPIYLLMDDADVLNHVQTRVLNSWIGTRTSHDVSIKVSTQMRYKTFAKVAGGTIEAPHDYSEVNIADLYTTDRGKYLDRVSEIVSKRLRLAGIERTPQQFFPVYQRQQERIEVIEEQIRSGKHKVSGRGFRSSDDVVRYARPIYMASLAGSKKASSKYFYAGFEELVHISSGLIRHFLEPAALMFSEQQARSKGDVERIDHGIQNDEIRKVSTLLMTSEFDRIAADDEREFDSEPPSTSDVEPFSIFADRKGKLRNLVTALGGTFRQKLLSDDAERRVFSVAISDAPQPDVEAVFELGVRHGYFQKSTIGNKDGTGRTTLFILTRRLAPYFNLDPSGFAGYLFASSDRLREAIANPNGFLRRVKEKGVSSTFEEGRQMTLFDT